MGSGKTTVGQLLAKKINLPFIDLDGYIEQKELLSISEIFVQKGEIYFRRKESLYLNELINNSNEFVLSLGGGTPCYANNYLLLNKKKSRSFFLKANVNTITERIKEEKRKRPILMNVTDNELASYIGQHLFERTYFYNYAQYSIDTNKKNLEDICEEIISLLK